MYYFTFLIEDQEFSLLKYLKLIRVSFLYIYLKIIVYVFELLEIQENLFKYFIMF